MSDELTKDILRPADGQFILSPEETNPIRFTQAIAKALEEARSAGADSTVTEVVITKTDDFDSEV